MQFVAVNHERYYCHSKPGSKDWRRRCGQVVGHFSNIPVKYTGLSTLGAMVGMADPFERNMPRGVVPVALAQDSGEELMSGKDGLIEDQGMADPGD